MQRIKFLKSPIFWLGLILVISFLIRLYKINDPVAAWHSWRQADTAAVSRNFIKEGYNPFLPKYDDMSGVAEDPVPNVNRYRLVEFPFYNSLVYFTYLLNGGVMEGLARLVNIMFALGSIIFIYMITKKYFGYPCALLAALLYGILPFSIFFTTTILPEPSLIFFSLGMFYFGDRWIREQKGFYLALVFMALAFLTKPMAVFYLMPLVIAYRQKEGKWLPVPRRYLLFLLLGLAPFILWRIWINQHPEGIPASNWLFNGNNIRFKPAFWKWIVGDRFGREILGAAGTVLLILGLLRRPTNGLLHFLALSMFLYLIVFATGNVHHDYYQLLIVPILVIFVARGVVMLFEGLGVFIPRLWTIPLALLLLFLTLLLTWYEVKGLWQINNPVILRAGQRADQILPKDAVVLAPYNGDTAFLYQINRSGWPFVPTSVDDLISDYGVDYLVSVAKDGNTKYAMEKYTIVEETAEYVIVDLNRSNPAKK